MECADPSAPVVVGRSGVKVGGMRDTLDSSKSTNSRGDIPENLGFYQDSRMLH